MEKTILVVDDEETNRDLFRQILHTRDYNIIEAENGKEALVVLEKARPDLILLDLFMTDGDGLMVVRAVRKNPQMRSIPIVVITAAANEEIHEKIMEEGCDMLVRKPVNMHDLLDTVHRFLA